MENKSGNFQTEKTLINDLGTPKSINSFFFIPKSMRVMPKSFKIWFENLQGKCAKCELDSFGSVLACKEFRTCNCLSWHVMSRMFSFHFGMKSFLKKHYYFWHQNYIIDISCTAKFPDRQPPYFWGTQILQEF